MDIASFALRQNRGMQKRLIIDRRPIPHTRLARDLGISSQWLADELEAERLPGVRAGDRWLCDPAAVETALLERARQTPKTSQPAQDTAGNGVKQ